MPTSGPLGAAALDFWVLGERHAGHPQREGCGPRGKLRGIGGEVHSPMTPPPGACPVSQQPLRRRAGTGCAGSWAPASWKSPQARRPRPPGMAPGRASGGSCFSTSFQISYLPTGALYSRFHFTNEDVEQRGTCTKRAWLVGGGVGSDPRWADSQPRPTAGPRASLPGLPAWGCWPLPVVRASLGRTCWSQANTPSLCATQSVQRGTHSTYLLGACFLTGVCGASAAPPPPTALSTSDQVCSR